MGATNQIQGALKCRAKVGSRTRKTRMPTETITKASNVPIETRLAASRIGRIAAQNAPTTPGMAEVTQGGWNFGWIRLTNCGSNPSLDMFQKTRDCPRSMTRMTDDNPAIAPTLINDA